MRLLLCLCLTAGWLAAPVVTAQESADPWLEKKAKVFKPLTDAQRQAISDAVPSASTAKPAKPRKVLVFFRCEGFIHNSIPFGNFAVEELGRKTQAFDVDFAETYDVFDKDNLAQYDAILLNSTTHLQFETPEQQNAFLDFVTGGKGLIGIHGASDNFGRHPEARAIVGGQFQAHPWHAGGTWAFKLNDPDHVLNRSFDGKGFWHKDEIYQYLPDSYVGPEVLRVLVSLDMSKDAVLGRIDDGPREVPVSWVRRAGDGRVFYTNFGHRTETYSQPAMLRHLVDGIQYALGDLEVDDAPTSKASPGDPALAPANP